MKTFIKLFAFIFLLTSCSSKKTISDETIQEYQQKGYTFGTIEAKSTGDCPWIISVNGSDLQYDPVNIDDEKFSKLKTKKTPFFFQFLRLRQQNRCNNISPIRLTEVVENP